MRAAYLGVLGLALAANAALVDNKNPSYETVGNEPHKITDAVAASDVVTQGITSESTTKHAASSAAQDAFEAGESVGRGIAEMERRALVRPTSSLLLPMCLRSSQPAARG